MGTVRRDVCRKLNDRRVISFTQILFIMPILKLSRRTVHSTRRHFYHGRWEFHARFAPEDPPVGQDVEVEDSDTDDPDAV